ncbi:sigma-70 family RNA polymerase sigma factor [Fusobacterium sp.]|uniref:sigma-70 family RNA polymerase sigma factor n=1 Tax=Fusobacterium sp. TaxID=68766 RepID=UPI00290249E0|nr:sigma-70 family RNA polymerase sigma factor [Fusobacterium sp.]MDU1910196.1 sigma-70 family RNA polymerase sigma factor [Fusobacterium sp.]
MENWYIIQKIRKGNQRAVEKIIKKYEKLIFSTAEKYFFYGAEKEDVLQEAYIGFLKAVNSYKRNKNTSFITYAVVCIKNHLIATFKKFNSSKQQILNEAINNSSKNMLNMYEGFTYKIFPSKQFHTPEEILIAKEKAELLQNFLETNLTKAEKEILTYILKELSYTEISKLTNKSPKVIDNAIQRIKRKAKAYMKKYDSYDI